MGLFFGFIVFVCCAWWWIRGGAFMAFALALGWALLSLWGAGTTPEKVTVWSTVAGVAIACAPYLIRTYLLPRREKRIVARPQPYGADRPRITGEPV